MVGPGARGAVGRGGVSFLAPATPSGSAYRPHPLHAAERFWPETNCYADLWIEMLHARGLDPHAMLGFGVTQDYEGDQFTFAKPPSEDLETLYGLCVQELSLYDTLERHAATQLARDSMLLVEVDGFFLPDTRATSYRREHTKTTIAVEGLDPAARRATYFHGATRAVLEAEDYAGVFGPAPDGAATVLPPYAERVRARGPALPPAELRAAALRMLARDLRRRPSASPIAAWRRDFAGQLARLTDEPALLHGYAFNLPRQVGAAIELLGSHLDWLDADRFAEERRLCLSAAAAAKAVQFRIIRAVTRRRPDACLESLDMLEAAHGATLAGLAKTLA